ncbi:MAG: DUF3850 domain-containing protein [Pseudomonadota bacterium]
MSKIHYLKTDQQFKFDVMRGEKRFEVRRNDRDFKQGDILMLGPVSDDDDKSVVPVRVDYILEGGQFGIEPGYVVMSVTGFHWPMPNVGFRGPLTRSQDND